jgi:hypothetical protein
MGKRRWDGKEGVDERGGGGKEEGERGREGREVVMVELELGRGLVNEIKKGGVVGAPGGLPSLRRRTFPPTSSSSVFSSSSSSSWSSSSSSSWSSSSWSSS